MNSLSGSEVKRLVLDNGLKLWQVAERWGLTDGNFSRRLRKPFNASEVERIKEIITDIKAKRAGDERE